MLAPVKYLRELFFTINKTCVFDTYMQYKNTPACSYANRGESETISLPVSRREPGRAKVMAACGILYSGANSVPK